MVDARSRRQRQDAAAREHDVFEQGPMMPRGVPLFLCVWLGFALVAPAFTEHDLTLRWVISSVVVIAILGAVVIVATMREWKKSVRVDARGLHVKGQLAVRARQIGFVEVLRGGTAATWSWPLSRPRGRERPRLPARQNLYGGLYGFGPAVAVEDRSEDEPTIWLIPSRDPHRLAASLEGVRDAAGGGSR
jgi:hypothetical protein